MCYNIKQGLKSLFLLITVLTLITQSQSIVSGNNPKEHSLKPTDGVHGSSSENDIKTQTGFTEEYNPTYECQTRSAELLNESLGNTRNIIFNFHPNSPFCFKMYENKNCDGHYIQYYSKRPIELQLTSDGRRLVDFNMMPVSFAACAETIDAEKLYDEHCENNMAVILDGTTRSIPKEGSCLQPNKWFINEVKVEAQNPSNNYCLEIFSERNCAGSFTRVLGHFISEKRSGILWKNVENDSGKVISFRKCSYCQKYPHDAVAPDTTDNSMNSMPAVSFSGRKQCNHLKVKCTPVPELNNTAAFDPDNNKTCFLFFNVTTCSNEPLVEQNVSMNEIQELSRKYSKFAGWSVVRCSDTVNYEGDGYEHCKKPFSKLTVEKILSQKRQTDSELKMTILYIICGLAVVMLVLVVIMSVSLWRKKRRMKNIRNRCTPNVGYDSQERRLTNVNHIDAMVELRALCITFADGFEIPRDRIKVEKNDWENMIGSGQFSVIFKGQLEPEGRKVAVKTVKSGQGATRGIKRALRECHVFKQLGRHPRIVEFWGVCTENVKDGELFVVMEFCEGGSLREFLTLQKNYFDNLVEDGEWSNDERVIMALESSSCRKDGDKVKFNTFQLFKWCIQVADAMDFLAERKIVLVNLSAKNILLDANYMSKISDFRLVKVAGDFPVLSNTANLKRRSEQKDLHYLPWRSLAIESLQDDVFSTESDIWGFAILIWEIFTLGAQPYSEFSYGSEFTLCLKHGYRLPAPNFATTECYELMLRCWYDAPEKRPTFKTLKSKLEEMIPVKGTPISAARSFQIIRSISNL